MDFWTRDWKGAMSVPQEWSRGRRRNPGKLFWGKENRTFSMRSFSFPQTPNLSWQRPKGVPFGNPENRKKNTLDKLFYMVLCISSISVLGVIWNKKIIDNTIFFIRFLNHYTFVFDFARMIL